MHPLLQQVHERQSKATRHAHRQQRGADPKLLRVLLSHPRVVDCRLERDMPRLLQAGRQQFQLVQSFRRVRRGT